MIDYYSQYARIPLHMVKDSPFVQHLRNYTNSFMQVKQKTFKISNPKYFLDKETKFVLKAFERESEYIDFGLFFIVAFYLTLLYLFISREDKLKTS